MAWCGMHQAAAVDLSCCFPPGGPACSASIDERSCMRDEALRQAWLRLPAQIISQLVETCRAHDFTDIVVVHEHRGEPDGLVVCHLPYGPTAYFGVYNTVRASACMASIPSAQSRVCCPLLL